MSPEAVPDGLVRGDDGRLRCGWGGSTPDYEAYHDTEWGVPVHDDRRLFEKLCLEGFQSGLSWLTILRKRPAFRTAFAAFDPPVVAAYGPDDVARLLDDAGIVRHRGKIDATINNAGRFLDLVGEVGSFDEYVWAHQPPAEERPPRFDWATLASWPPAPSAAAMAKDLKRRGWRFVGPTTVYAFMQSMGLVDDHVEGCWRRGA